MPKEIPILFSTAMVQAILEGRKTETRREVKPQPQPIATEVVASDQWKGKDFVARFPYDREPVVYEVTNLYKCPYGQPGDVLWVRESFTTPFLYDGAEQDFYYRADFDTSTPHVRHITGCKWSPSIHMPKAAARIWLEVTEVKVERLQDITEDSAKAEGVFEYEDETFKNYFKKKGLRAQDGVECLLAKGSFQSLWCSINGIESWTANPWVWVIKFKVLSTTGKPQSLTT